MNSFKIGDQVEVLNGGKNILTGTRGHITELSRPGEGIYQSDGVDIPACRVDWPECTHVYGGKRGIWVDGPSLRRLDAES
ncbi:hypothetical protein [Deinococcus marmoris]|uniref:Uncharacterized protein n=1 Tax=Deinococcus marmoris TaxID=249408 RepID=A0A1U7P4Q1_9DEIO|nr:hypothetical protein [Deinococcus marmoris]OLV20136.1 hypothetical protein BOO71_0000436 [Deinococcus marmoris]